MGENTARPDSKARSWIFFIARMVIAGAIGLGFGYGMIQAIKADVIRMEDYLNIFLAVSYVVLGLTAWINPYVKQTRFSQEKSLWLRAALMIVTAVMLAMPVLAAPLRLDPAIAYAFVALLFAGQLITNHLLMRRTDELMKQVVTDTHVVSATILSALLFFYAAAERLGLAVGVSVWTLNGVMWFIYFLVTQWAWMKRGVGNTPLVHRREDAS